MYLPASELQQYKGFWVCPYCIMELRDEDRIMQKPPKQYKKPDYPISPIVYTEKCERCGREAEYFYIWNGRRLCKSCLDEEQKKWGMVGGGPGAAPQRLTYGKDEGILGSIINRFLERIGLRKRKTESEIVVAPKIKATEAKKNKSRKSNVVAFGRGKPLTEEPEKKEEGSTKPKIELLIKKKKRKKRKKSGKKET